MTRTKALAPTTAGPAIQWSAPQLTKRAAELIDRQPAHGIGDQVPNDREADEIRLAIRALERGLADSPRDEIARMVGRLATIFRDERLSRGEAELRMATYCDLLADVPPDLLALAFRRAGQTFRFFPTVAEIRGQVRAELSLRLWRVQRARWLVAIHERDWAPPAPPVTDQEREAVAAGLGRLAASMSTGPSLTPAEIEAREIQRAELIARVEREAQPRGADVDMCTTTGIK
jgi:hypothetical protein